MTRRDRERLHLLIDARRRELVADALEVEPCCPGCGREHDGGRTLGCHTCTDREHSRRKRNAPAGRERERVYRQAWRERNRAVASATVAGGGSFTPESRSSRRAATPSEVGS